ncbi:MAG TPA: hypothetical protein VF491_13590 [Vicinamibacterales bacterium]
MIDQLPELTPDPQRANRIRARCHKALVRHARPKTRPFLAVERAICLGFGAAYLSSIVFDVMGVLVR